MSRKRRNAIMAAIASRPPDAAQLERWKREAEEFDRLVNGDPGGRGGGYGGMSDARPSDWQDEVSTEDCVLQALEQMNLPSDDSPEEETPK